MTALDAKIKCEFLEGLSSKERVLRGLQILPYGPSVRPEAPQLYKKLHIDEVSDGSPLTFS